MNGLQILLITAIEYFVRVLQGLIFARVVLSWIRLGRNSKITYFIYNLTEPILEPIRRMLDRSPLGRGAMLDFSPIIAIFMIGLVQQLLTSLIFML